MRPLMRCRLLLSLVLFVPLVLVPAAACAGHGPVVAASGRVLLPESLARQAAADGPWLQAGLFAQPQRAAGGVVAARADLQTRVTLAGLLAVAAHVHPRIRRAQALLLAAEAHLGQASSVPNPTLALEARRIPVTAGSSFADTSWRATVRQPLPVTGREHLRGEQAEHARRAALYAALAEGLTLELAVRQAFVDYWAAHQQVALQQQAVALGERLAAAARAASDAGVQPELHGQRAQAHVARQRVALAAAQDALAAAEEALRVAAGDASLPLGPPPGEWTLPVLPEGWQQRGREWAVAHPLARGQQAAAEVAQRGDTQRSRTGGDVVLGLGYEYEGLHNRHWLTAQLEVTLPVFDRGDQAARAAAAEAQAAYAERDYAIVRLLSRHARLRAAHATAQQRLAAYEDVLLPTAEQELAVRRAQHEAAAAANANANANGADLAAAEHAVLEAEARLLTLRSEAWQARAALGRVRHELALLTRW